MCFHRRLGQTLPGEMDFYDAFRVFFYLSNNRVSHTHFFIVLFFFHPTRNTRVYVYSVVYSTLAQRLM